MSSNVGYEKKVQKSCSQVPERGDCGGGSGDRPIGDGHDGEVVAPVSQPKGKRKLLEVEGSTTSGEANAGPLLGRKALRKRLTFTQKMEILQLLKDNNVKQMEIARRYGCSRSAVSDIRRNRAGLEARKKSPGFNGEAKSDKCSDFPELEKQVVQMVGDARRRQVPVTREVISSFGRTAKNQILSSEGLSEGERKRLEKFRASTRWADKFVRRQGLVSKALHGEGSGGGREASREGINAARDGAGHEPRNKFKVDEPGLFKKLPPRRTYLAEFEGRKTARGSKDTGGGKGRWSHGEAGEKRKGSLGHLVDNDPSSQQVLTHVVDTINKISSSMALASEETLAEFKDLRDMLDQLGLEPGDRAAQQTVDVLARWLNLEDQKDVSEALELERRKMILEHIQNTHGESADDDEGEEGNCVDGTEKTPVEIFSHLDKVDQYARSTGKLAVLDHVRFIRNSLCKDC